MLLFVLVMIALTWMHFSICRMERRVIPELAKVSTYLPELSSVSSLVLTDWNPEDQSFWEKTGKRIATRNLWISIPALLLHCAVWMVWSVVVINLPSIGFLNTRPTLLAGRIAWLVRGDLTDFLFIGGCLFLAAVTGRH